MKEWATNISFVFWWSFFPNTTLSILSFQKTFFKSTMTSPLFCDYIHFIVCFLVVFFKFFITRVTFFVFFLDCFGSWVFRGKQPGTLQRGHQLLFDALVTSFTAETLVVCSEHREPARFDHQQYLDDSHGKGLSMAQSVRTLDGGWIFERNTMKKVGKKIIPKNQHQWFFIPAPFKEGGVFFSYRGCWKISPQLQGSGILGVFFEKPVRNEKFNAQVLCLDPPLWVKTIADVFCRCVFHLMATDPPSKLKPLGNIRKKLNLGQIFGKVPISALRRDVASFNTVMAFPAPGWFQTVRSSAGSGGFSAVKLWVMRKGFTKVNDGRWFDDLWWYNVKHSKANKKNYVFFPQQEIYFAFTTWNYFPLLCRLCRAMIFCDIL